VAHGYAVQSVYQQSMAFIHEHDPHAKVWSAVLMSGQYFNVVYDTPSIEPDESIVKAGDWILVPEWGMHAVPLRLNLNDAERVTRIDVDNFWPWATVPAYYGAGGGLAILPRGGTPWIGLNLVRMHRTQIIQSPADPGTVAGWLEADRRPLPPASARAVLNVYVQSTPEAQERIMRLILISGDSFFLHGLSSPDPRARALSATLLGESETDQPFVERVLKEVQSRDPDPSVKEAARKADVDREMRKVGAQSRPGR
jgi:hypothetical protein